LGLARNLALADARAMIPSLEVVDDEPAANAALLGAIADWAERYTPLVAEDGASGLQLDITGATHLFGGEAALVADIVTRLTAQGFLARAAIADTPGAAYAAARFTGTAVVPHGGNLALLEPLSLAALRIDSEIVAAMDRVGLKRIGQIAGAPRAPLAARFGRILIRRLDQALGFDEEAIDPRRPAPSFIAERRFAEPISREEDIAATLTSLAGTLAESLERHGEGARCLEYTLFRVDGVVTRIAVGAGRPIRAPKLILALFREKFAALGDNLDAGYGFDMARLAVTASAAADAAQIDLTGDATDIADVDALLDRIGARLGPESVKTIVLRDSHIPERAEILLTRDEGSRETPGGEDGRRPDREATKTEDGRRLDREESTAFIARPLRLFPHPEPVEAIAEVPDGPPVHFRWRRVLYRVARAEGPERIADEWWHMNGLTRDYFRIEDWDGHRFWLYREGLYAAEAAAPRWFMHGIFG
jgi:protein ImuB